MANLTSLLDRGLLLAQETSTVYYEFQRAPTEWWQWILLLLVCAVVLAYVVWVYLYDSVELSRGFATLLTILRLLAFVGILVYFLGPERRTQQKIVSNSRVLLAVDTSASMAEQDNDATSVPAAPSRIDEVVQLLKVQQGLINKLREQHDVVVYRFDQEARPIEVASFPKRPTDPVAGDPNERAQAKLTQSLNEARITTGVAAALLVLALVAGGISFLFRTRATTSAAAGDATSWSLLVSMVALICAVVVFAVANLLHPQVGVAALFGLRAPKAVDNRVDVDGEEPVAEPEVQWDTALTPKGDKTRIGDTLRFLINKERGGPIAGIVVFTDGVNNWGADPKTTLPAARTARIPIFTVGLGSDTRPANVQVVDLEAPQRVYPGDDFNLHGYLQAFGMAGDRVEVVLASAPAGSDPEDTSVETIEERRQVRLSEDGEITSLEEFTVTPQEQGEIQYRLRVIPQNGDVKPRDNQKSANVQVIDRRVKVLIVAGGPTREYRFLRNMLYRDKDTLVDVFLQTAEPTSSQEADDVLTDFPDVQKELFDYDCIIAFDPDWLALNETQLDLLERWTSREAGGLIVVAGPVFTPEWTRFRRGSDRRVDILRNLYPVVFYSQTSATLDLGRFGGSAAWPLQFSRDGEEAEFLFLEPDSIRSEQAWAAFEGVYGYYAVKDPKPGARVFARFSDPATAIDNELPIYLAGHFYGAGRVFFQASGEMWRIRAEDDAYFDHYYTKLINWVSQGRLLRDSERGMLLVEKDRALLRDQIPVRAILMDAQLRPLTDDSVDAMLQLPDSTTKTLTLQRVKDSARDGTYAGQFTATQKGDYLVELAVPGDDSGNVLTREVRVQMPERESLNPQRNDALLKEIAEKTDATYYIGTASVVNASSGRPALEKQVVPQDQESFLPGMPDDDFNKQLMGWLLGLICGVLALEWTMRRLSRLA